MQSVATATVQLIVFEELWAPWPAWSKLRVQQQIRRKVCWVPHGQVSFLTCLASNGLQVGFHLSTNQLKHAGNKDRLLANLWHVSPGITNILLYIHAFA